MGNFSMNGRSCNKKESIMKQLAIISALVLSIISSAQAQSSPLSDSGVINDPFLFSDVKRLTVDYPANIRFGESASVDGDILVIGTSSDNDNGYETGSAYVFARHRGGANTWSQVKKLTARSAEELFGGLVSINGDTLVARSLNLDDGTGAVYIFRLQEMF
jgi:hypothetical protein